MKRWTCGIVHILIFFDSVRLEFLDCLILHVELSRCWFADRVVMARAIREYYDRTGYRVGFKPAGGIRTAKQAIEWQILMKEEQKKKMSAPDRRELIDRQRPVVDPPPVRAARHSRFGVYRPPAAANDNDLGLLRGSNCSPHGPFLVRGGR